MTGDQEDDMKHAIKVLAAVITDSMGASEWGVASFRVETRIASRARGLTTEFLLYPPSARERALLIGTGGSMARDLRACVRTMAVARGLPDEVDLQVSAS